MILLELDFLARITRQALIILGGCKDVGVFSELSKDKLMVESARKRIGQIDQTHEREEALTRVAAHGTALPASHRREPVANRYYVERRPTDVNCAQ